MVGLLRWTTIGAVLLQLQYGSNTHALLVVTKHGGRSVHLALWVLCFQQLQVHIVRFVKPLAQEVVRIFLQGHNRVYIQCVAAVYAYV